MHSEVVIIARANRSPHIESAGGIAARRTERDTVHLVSSAATPLGGDSIHIRLVVEAGARLRLRTAAATMTLPGAATTESHAGWTLEVAGELDLDPLPTIVAATSAHFVTTRVTLADSGRLRLVEKVQIGRAGERQGFWSGALSADIDGKPLLRHRVELGNGSLADDEIAAPKASISELHYPRSDVETAGLTLALAGGGCLSTWQGARL
ncbi:Urease accessory protein UreD [Mycolicibacterium vanbaalenii]|uniref:Urease accessory protein UreD n=1 Tax=Mycolicibacterium vanbaalenii TaxID=110539 RepID=A0A5S9PQC0_MYCVN|nr:urease accessory protein UreD [Mycolicibacterium vanbaalenii]CAA0106762.1 Urease accessory protein UreD [Mycolicibacterium vanbaalenii]